MLTIFENHILNQRLSVKIRGKMVVFLLKSAKPVFPITNNIIGAPCETCESGKSACLFSHF